VDECKPLLAGRPGGLSRAPVTDVLASSGAFSDARVSDSVAAHAQTATPLPAGAYTRSR